MVWIFDLNTTRKQVAHDKLYDKYQSTYQMPCFFLNLLWLWNKVGVFLSCSCCVLATLSISLNDMLNTASAPELYGVWCGVGDQTVLFS